MNYAQRALQDYIDLRIKREGGPVCLTPPSKPCGCGHFGCARNKAPYLQGGIVPTSPTPPSPTDTDNKDTDNKDTDTKDWVNPDHYKGHPKGIEAIEVIEDNPYLNLGNAMKYLWRVSWGSKGRDIEDLNKAAWYINREIKRRENNG